ADRPGGLPGRRAGHRQRPRPAGLRAGDAAGRDQHPDRAARRRCRHRPRPPRRRRALFDRAGRVSIGGKLDPTRISGRGWCVVGWFERPEFGANVGLIDEIYRQYLDNPESVSPAWRDFFAENEAENGETERATIHEARAPVKEPAPEPAKAERPPASKAPDAP